MLTDNSILLIIKPSITIIASSYLSHTLRMQISKRFWGWALQTNRKPTKKAPATTILIKTCTMFNGANLQASISFHNWRELHLI